MGSNYSDCSSQSYKASQDYCCCDILTWERQKFKETVKVLYDHLCNIPKPGYSSDSEPGNKQEIQEPPTAPPPPSEEELEKLTPKEKEEVLKKQEEIKKMVEVKQANYEKYQEYAKTDCNGMTDNKKKDDCEI